LLIDPTSKSDGIPLRAGIHRLVILFAAGPPILKIAKDGGPLVPVPQSMLVCPEQLSDCVPSPGLDDAGFRLPEVCQLRKPGVLYWHYRSAADIDLNQLAPSRLTLAATGRFDRPQAAWTESRRDLSIVSTLVDLPEDARYQFSLEENPHAWLYLGHAPQLIDDLMRPDSSDRDPLWTVHGSGGGQVEGRIRDWTERDITISPETSSCPDLVIPRAHVRSVSALTEPPPRKPSSTSNTEEQIVIVKVDNDRTTEVRGRVMGIDQQRLLIQYRGETRRIQLEKCIGVWNARTIEPDRGTTYLLARFAGDCMVPVSLSANDADTISLRTLWGQTIQVAARDALELSLTVQNGRVQFLSDLQPAEVEQTPYFDRVIPWRRDCALDGTPLVFGTRVFSRGVAVHSQTRLTYDLGGHYARFMATVGIDIRLARWGDAAVQVRADDRVIFARTRLRGEDAPIELDVPLEGARRLTLSTEFGEGQDVGDQVIWANARLITIE
jgi:hypothetical protein